tara:strand:- start:721 stop:1197 length:477 start_codon:yes stop_codon:yes gene_type:complete
MSIEIERRFLIQNNNWEKSIQRKSKIIQGYLNTNSKDWSVRIRSENNKFKLTLKKYINHASNYEFEYQIPQHDGEIIISTIENPIIKDRFYILLNDKTWIIDRFKEENDPLEIAEVELHHIDEAFAMPDFVSKEITDLKRFSNFELFKHPFSKWRKKI